MPESVPVRCPACRRAHRYTAPSYPCACGAPVAPPLDPDAVPVPVGHRAWQEEWVTVRCGRCGHDGEWPRPELGCPCGTVLRIPVTGPRAPAPAVPSASSGRPALRPVPIRTARDAVTAAVLYLRRLGHEDVRRTVRRPPAGVGPAGIGLAGIGLAGIGLAGRGVLAQVDPSARPATLRDVECLWLTAMTESARCLYFSLAGYAEDARARADALGVPLFLLGPTGVPRPVNGPADALDADGT